LINQFYKKKRFEILLAILKIFVEVKELIFESCPDAVKWLL